MFSFFFFWVRTKHQVNQDFQLQVSMGQFHSDFRYNQSHLSHVAKGEDEDDDNEDIG